MEGEILVFGGCCNDILDYSEQTVSKLITVMCLSIGTHKIINFPFVPNGKLIIFMCSKIRVQYSLIVLCSNIGTPKNHHFPFEIFGKVVALGVPILKHFRGTVN